MDDGVTVAEDLVWPDARILVVDDERGLRRTLTDIFNRLGYRAEGVASGEEALECLTDDPADLVILDLNMPGMGGDEVLRLARPIAPETLFIILTAYGTLDSAIAAIRHGAFDYLLKPSPVEQILHVVHGALKERREDMESDTPVALLERALHELKRTDEPAQAAPKDERFLQSAEVTIDTRRHLVVVRGQVADLTPTEFDILVYLMQHQGQVVSCRELVLHLRDCALDERDARPLVRSHIHRLRQKVEHNPSAPELILTIRGSGYLFTSDRNLAQTR
jgi:DNA-binding response OmpR family regulator